MAFLPVNRCDMEQRGWDELDFLFVTGDAYVDHPSFGTAIITRVLEDQGYRIGVCAQPNHLDPASLIGMGVPKLGVLVSSGVVDSMVNHYTAAKRRRSEDRYSPGGKAGVRPDRALIRYCTMVREQMGEIPLIIGGIEASLRRFAHYDYWSGKVRRSILQDSRADILVYGMGEDAIIEIADLLSKGVNIRKITSIRGTCVYLKPDDLPARITAFVDFYDTYVYPREKKTSAELRKYSLPQDDHCLMLRMKKSPKTKSLTLWHFMPNIRNRSRSERKHYSRNIPIAGSFRALRGYRFRKRGWMQFTHCLMKDALTPYTKKSEVSRRSKKSVSV
jgi:uncharacterized radical SAM protein YgiQ